ncbi:MAG: alpha/beta fold hydrolase [Rhodospirillales bacterium]
MFIHTPRSEGSLPSRSTFRLVKRPARGRNALDCWIALPHIANPDATPLVAVHGIRRCARLQAAAFAARAAALGRPVIAPLFDSQRWSGYQRVVERRRADLALLALMETLRVERIWGARRFDLFGHSGGAQFAHRFAMLYPHLIGRLSVCAAGWWTFPDRAPFPLGLGADDRAGGRWGPRIEATLPAFLSLEMAVAVGDDDDVADDATRRGIELDRQQGADRKTRAIRWVDALTAATGARGITPRIRLSILPDCGHDFAACIRRGGLGDLVLPDVPHRFGGVGTAWPPAATPRHPRPRPSERHSSTPFPEGAQQ